MGAGGVIQQNSVVKATVNDPSIYGLLPAGARGYVDGINAKALGDWTETDYAYMVAVLMVARHC